MLKARTCTVCRPCPDAALNVHVACRLFRLLEALPGAAPRAAAFSSAEGPAARAAALSAFQVGCTVHQGSGHGPECWAGLLQSDAACLLVA